MFVFYQTPCLLDDHVGDLYVPAGRFIKGAGNDFTLYRACHLGDLLRPFVNQQDNQIAFRMVGSNRLRHILQQHGLAGLWRRYNQATLTFSQRCDQINDARGDVLRAAIAALQRHAFIGMQRGQVLKRNLVFGIFGFLVIDFADL